MLPSTSIQIRGNTLYPIAIAVLILALHPPTLQGQDVHHHYAVDPAPLIRLLQDTLTSIVDGDYSRAVELCSLALNTTLPTNLRHIHEGLYRSILDLVNILNSLERLEWTTPTLDVLYELHIVRDKLRSALTSYTSRLSHYFIDRSTKDKVMRSIEGWIDSFTTEITMMIDRITYIYIQSRGGGELYIHAKHPSQINGGDRYTISILVNSSTPINNASIRLMIIYGDAVGESIDRVVSVNTWIDIELKVPGAEELEAMGVDPLAVSRVKIVMIARAVRENHTLIGYAVSNASIIYRKPTLKFNVPRYIHPNQPIAISIEADIDVPLNLTMYIDDMSEKSIVFTTTLAPGVTSLAFNLQNLSTGYHKLIFVTNPRGKYVAYIHTAIFTILRYRAPITMYVEELVITPLNKLEIDLYVNAPINYSITIYIDGGKVIGYSYVDSSTISLQVNPPPTILLWRYRVGVEIQPLNPFYESSYREGYVYVVNLPMLMGATAILVFTLSIPSSTKHIRFTIRMVKLVLEGIVGGRRMRVLVDRVAEQRFRRPRLHQMYRRVLGIISRYVEPPRKSETLREFYRRFEASVLGHIRYLVKMFLDVYEEDVYSNHSVDVGKAEDIVRRLEKG